MLELLQVFLYQPPPLPLDFNLAANAWIQLALLGGSTLAGLFGNRGKKEQQSRDETGTTSFDTTKTSSFSPEALPLRDLLLRRAMQNIDSDIPLGEEALEDLELQGTQDINRINDSLAAKLKSNLARRGLSYSPGATSNTLNFLEGQRGQQLGALSRELAHTRFQLPQLREQILLNRLGFGRNLLSSLPKTERTIGQSTEDIRSTGTNQTSGNRLGGAAYGFTNAFLTNLNQGSEYGGLSPLWNWKKPSDVTTSGSGGLSPRQW